MVSGKYVVTPCFIVSDLSSNFLSFGDTPRKSKEDDVTPKASEKQASFFTEASSMPPTLPSIENERTADICGGKETPPPQSGATAANHPLALFGSGTYDPDTSIHEVEITDQEMEKLQEEFSDLDDTMMSDSGEQTFPDGPTPVQGENLFSQPHPLRQEDLFSRMDNDAGDDQGFDYCDMQRQPDQGEGQEEEGSKCLDTT